MCTGNVVKAGSASRWAKLGIASGFLLVLGLLGGCANAPSTLQPQGPAAARLAELWWVLFTIATIVVVVVILLLLYALFRRRRAGDTGGIGNGRAFVLIGGGLIPAIILIGVIVYTVNVQAAIETPPTPALTVEIIGHQWWWEVYYPAQKFTTANEIHIPVGQPVLLKLTTADVNHSFWAPELQAKMDLIAGQTNTTWLTANRAGEYRVECAEYCGLQHAHMGLLIIAEAPDKLQAWLDNEQQPAAAITDPRLRQGQQIFLNSACVYCHAIRGTTVSGQIGPDLTHIASRRTLGAALLPNNRGSLSGWIVNAQALKPGNEMPPMYLDAGSLQALVTYLESLK